MPQLDSPGGRVPLVVLGAAAGKRVRLLQAARMQLGLPPAQLIEWRDFLAAPECALAALNQACVFKIESPGDDEQAQFRLLQDGCGLLGRAAHLPLAHGELSATDAWFAGLSLALGRIATQLAARPQVRVLNAPEDLLTMTDKLACQQHLAARQVPVPLLLGEVAGYAHLRALMEQHGMDRVYLKARYGSSAAGVVAYRRNSRGQEQATTSAQLVRAGDGVRLYNDKRMHCYTAGADIAQLIDLLAAQQAYAEAWLPKPRAGNGHYDIRQVTLSGQAAHRVARIGSKMMTNLHLDNARGDVDMLLDADGLSALEQVACQAAATFPRSHVIGLDLVVRQGRAHVLEANAFGDLLPGLLWRGRDTYAEQLRQFFHYEN